MIALLVTALFTHLSLGFNAPTVNSIPAVPTENIVSERKFSLDDRYTVKSVNEVFKKNILLNLAYLNGSVTKKQDINWDKIENPFHFTFTLKPGQVFAFHDSVLKEYEGKVVKTTHAHFGGPEGFVSDGYLFGDGVCHLASLINWAAQDAHLGVLVTKNHNFAVIPEVPKTYGVSIYTDPEVKGSGAHNNLYVTNTKDHAVTFHFDYENDELKVSVGESQKLALKN